MMRVGQLLPGGDELLSGCTTADEKPLRDLLIEAMGSFTERFPEAATRIAALAAEGWLENHQTAGSLDRATQELLNALQGVPTTDAD
jgi:hypothetical protein